MTKNSVTSDAGKAAIFYDGSCPLCSAEVRYYRGRDDSDVLEFVDVSVDSPKLPDGINRSDAMQRFHAQCPDGSVVSGVRAFIEVWSRTRGWRWLARIAKVPGVVWVLEGLYRVFLVFRPVVVWVFVALRGRRKP